MAIIEKYEDLRCWQESRKLVNQVYQVVSGLQSQKEFALADQLKRAAISVMTNIAEGFNRYHKKDFIRFLDYAQSSAQEVKSLLYIVLDIAAGESGLIKKIQEQCDYCQALTLALLKHVKGSINNSSKVKEPGVIYLEDTFVKGNT